MKFTLIAIGKNAPSWVNEGYRDYAKRLPPDYALQLIEISSPFRGRNANIPQIQEKEAEQIISAIPLHNHVVALECKGQSWDTPALAKQMQTWHDDSQDVTLLIGGPDGLSPSIRPHTNTLWSLSALTLPHPLVRIVVAEQLYRAWSILVRHPYHR
jgi:23S rRNA (pseudouridine1915-N3)-methyltransferase